MASRGLIVNAIVPLRREPDDRSEMESQLLFGDTLEILDKRRQWRFIRNDFDGYEGWIDEKALVSLPEKEYKDIKSATEFYVADLISAFSWDDGSRQILTA